MSALVDMRGSWDAATIAQLNHFQSMWPVYLDNLLADLADSFGPEGVRFIRPHTRGNNKWQPSTGETEASIHYQVDHKRDGWEITYHGKKSADYIDVGNFPASQVRFARDYGLKAFPISARAGMVHTHFAAIHGMGHSSPEYPKQFSRDGMKHLHKNVGNLAENALQKFLDRLVL